MNSNSIADNFVFVGFNSRVIALDRETGAEQWVWKAPKGWAQYVAVLPDGDRLIVSVQGYTYCLDAETGRLIWQNHLEGMGYGIPSLTMLYQVDDPNAGAVAAVAQTQQG